MKENVQALVTAYKELSEEDQTDFEFETFNAFSYENGITEGRKRVAVEQILELIDDTGDLDILDEVHGEVMEILGGDTQEVGVAKAVDGGEKN